MKSQMLFMCMLACFSGKAAIRQAVVESAVEAIAAKGGDRLSAQKGVSQVARLWREPDGNEEAFKVFCVENYICDPAEKSLVFDNVSGYMEAILGHYNEMSLQLQKKLHVDKGTVHPVDHRFGAYNPSAHFLDDMYENKIGFIIALNFPKLTLEEKKGLGEDRRAWAYARLGDIFTERVPAELVQARANAESAADVYISAYNIYMGSLRDKKGKQLFPQDMVLLSHWNLRDEIKANYNKGKEGEERQRMVYEVMKRIISQDIPRQVINSGQYEWNPYTNMVSGGGKTVALPAESTVRYQKMLDNFRAMREIDRYTGNTYIDRKFSDEMEVAVDEVTELFDRFLTSPELKKAGKIISRQLGRPLEAYDIWYDGFKVRSNLDENKLNEMTRALYPDAEAFDRKLPDILTKLGFSPERAAYLAGKITVDPARGSGHAWGAAMKGQQSRLRTRIPERGMDYKGYNIAIHEFGHNVEQTISMYDADYFTMGAVPNTAFTEALAFVFQKRDLDLLGIKDENPDKKKMDVLDKFWSMYEITGVSMLDISVWKWLYAHPEATAAQLRDAVVSLSKEIWNRYYAPVFGVKDQTVLAVYSHMVSYPLYLSAYAFGQIIEFQLEEHLDGKDFAAEVDRIYRLGRLTPGEWMVRATGGDLSVEPILNAVRRVL